MAPETQYRVTSPKVANLREEPSTKAGILTQLRTGTIVHLDHADGEWYYVTFGGWVHKTTVKALTSTEAIK
jgi:SH3-like domain-containing protein